MWPSAWEKPFLTIEGCGRQVASDDTLQLKERLASVGGLALTKRSAGYFAVMLHALAPVLTMVGLGAATSQAQLP